MDTAIGIGVWVVGIAAIFWVAAKIGSRNEVKDPKANAEWWSDRVANVGEFFAAAWCFVGLPALAVGLIWVAVSGVRWALHHPLF